MIREGRRRCRPPRQAPRAATYWRRLRSQPVGLAGTVIFVLFLLIAIFGPLLAPYGYADQNVAERLQPPSTAHFFGTDNFGRDVFSRVLVGAREVFYLGGIGTILAAIIGTSLGLIAGYAGRLWDEGIMRLLDVLLAFPGPAAGHGAPGHHRRLRPQPHPGDHRGLHPALRPHRPKHGARSAHPRVRGGGPPAGRESHLPALPGDAAQRRCRP